MDRRVEFSSSKSSSSSRLVVVVVVGEKRKAFSYSGAVVVVVVGGGDGGGEKVFDTESTCHNTPSPTPSLCSAQLQWVLPGHGDIHRFDSPEAAREDLDRCIKWMEKQPRGYTPLLRFIAWIEVRKSRSPALRWLGDTIILPREIQR